MPQLTTPGTYECTVTSAVVDDSEPTKPVLVLEYATSDSHTIRSWNYLHGGAFQITLDMLRAVFGFDDNFDTVEGQTVGKPCSIVVDNETYNGKTRLRVKFTNRIGGGATLKPAAGSTLAKLSSLAKRTPRPTNLPKPPPAPKAPVEDEDKPF